MEFHGEYLKYIGKRAGSISERGEPATKSWSIPPLDERRDDLTHVWGI